MSTVPPLSARMERLDPDRVARLRSRSLVTTADWPVEDLETVWALAEAFAAADRAGVRTPVCPHEVAYALFFDQSTRTRSAWAGAAARLGMHPIVVDGSSTQVSHGETAMETGAMLGMNSHALGVRHDLILGEGNRFIRDVLAGIDGYLAAADDPRSVPVVNLQCDVDHPTQTMADALWLRERLGDLAGRRVTVSWAYSPSYAKPLSVPRGLVSLLGRLGVHVTLAHPPGYHLGEAETATAEADAAAAGGSLRITGDMDDAFRDAEVVYPKSWGAYDLMEARVAAKTAGDTEAMAAIEQRALARNDEHRDWICDERRMGLTRGGQGLYCHCLPADIGAEVSPAVMERHALDVAREANGKLYVIMALLAGAKVDGLVDRLTALTSRPGRDPEEHR